VASTIAGATSVEQLRSNAAAIHWRPTSSDCEALEKILSMPFTPATEGSM